MPRESSLQDGLAGTFGILVVMATVGAVGFALDAWEGFAWSVGGACAWTIAFALGAHETRRPPVPWSLAGGLLCGIAWSFTWPIAHELEIYQAVHSAVVTPAWILAWAVPAGIGGGLLGGIALSRHGAALAVLVGLPLGFVAALALVQEPIPFYGPRWLGLLVGMVGAAAGIPIGLRIGRWGRPMIFVFDDLAPYLREMTVPFAGFVAGYLALVVLFAGMFGTLWRVSSGSAFVVMPEQPVFFDFIYASVGIATGTGNTLTPRSALAKLLVSAEAVFAQGWLIAVFAAVGAHLSPRFSKLAELRRAPGPETATTDPTTRASADTTTTHQPQRTRSRHRHRRR